MSAAINRELELVYKKLKERGIRVTPQRRVILEYLKNSSSHPTAEEIYHYSKERLKRVSLGTVYNTLHMLKEIELIQELSFGDLSSRYDGRPENHYHITCDKCGKVVDFGKPVFTQLEQEAEEETGFLINTHRLEFSGVCRQCQGESLESSMSS